MPRPTAAALLLCLCACAAAQRPGSCPACPASPAATDAASAPQGPPKLEYPPEEVKVSRLDLELGGKNDEELFAIGTAAFGASDFARAATAFSRLADLFPRSRHEPTALFDAGLAFERLEEWRLAVERFRTLATRYEGPDAIEAAFRIAECQYHLHELADARATLDALLRREGLPPTERIRALAQRGILELEEGRPEDAERSLRLAVTEFRATGDQERLDEYYAAQAQYYLGEVYRGWFRALPLDPSKGDEAALQKDLEQKAEMLLSAQGHYLRAIRMGNDRWAVASGFRIGELYDALRSDLLDAPLPPGLDDEHAQAYRAELRRRVRVLAAKAITAYEQTLARAARSSVDDLRFLSDAQGSLDRLKAAIAEDARPGT
ncbi:MAG TPA: tetratricopeptide repeat protein [Anaeromyxobacter sp.]